MQDEAVTITDPLPDTYGRPGGLFRIFLPLIRDEHDLPFVRLALLLSAVFWPMAVYVFVPGNFRWWMAPIYWVPYLWFLGPFILMLHNTSHRVLFKKKYSLLNKYIPWLVGPFVGITPETYYAHHIGMHHQDGNLPDDLSSTMAYQRDSIFGFLRYYLTFLGAYPFITSYFIRKKRFSMLRRFWIGELSYFAAVGGLTALNWEAAVAIFWIPFFFTRLMLMAGNWAQHAFIDHADPTDDYKTVTSFINSVYNHRCFNDGYHLGHHLKASRHWLDMPRDFLEKREEMIRRGSIVFHGIDYFVITALLIAKQYRRLAGFYVQLDPENPKSTDEIVALFKERVRRFSAEELAAVRAGTYGTEEAQRQQPAAA